MLNEIITNVKEYEEEILFDVEAPEHWYEVEFKKDEVILYEVDEYHYNGDEWGEIKTSTTSNEINNWKCTLEEFTNFVIQFFKWNKEYKNLIIIKEIKN